MKIYPAIAAIEFDDIPAGVVATDAMLKKAPIGFVKSGTITRGRFLTLIGGSPAAVREAALEGVRSAEGHLIDEVMLPDVHPHVYDAILGGRRPRNWRSLAIIETTTVSASIRAAEAALKGTPVELVELRVGDTGLAGKGVLILEGHLHDLEAAVSLAEARAAQGAGRASWRLIAAPHEAMTSQLAQGSRFTAAPLMDLEGENV
jgi:microcompartment protein CcmL/EutN